MIGDTATQSEKGKVFRALHERAAFIMPNPWDVGSAHVLAHLGFEALATTSGSALYRAAMGSVLRAAYEMRDAGTFTFAANAASPRDIDKTFPA